MQSRIFGRTGAASARSASAPGQSAGAGGEIAEEDAIAAPNGNETVTLLPVDID